MGHGGGLRNQAVTCELDNLTVKSVDKPIIGVLSSVLSGPSRGTQGMTETAIF